jgi:hypothetical protein
MNNMIGVQSVAEWRFGTHVMDLYRSMLVCLKQNRVSENLVRHFAEGFRPG